MVPLGLIQFIYSCLQENGTLGQSKINILFVLTMTRKYASSENAMKQKTRGIDWQRFSYNDFKFCVSWFRSNIYRVRTVSAI